MQYNVLYVIMAQHHQDGELSKLKTVSSKKRKKENTITYLGITMWTKKLHYKK
jgi:hypothetical protein